MQSRFFAMLLAVASLVVLPVVAQAQVLPRDDPEAYYYSVEYAALSEQERRLWATLGWDEAAWSAESPLDWPPTEWTNWTDLSAEQRDALTTLGYDEESWDENRPRNSIRIVEALWDGLDWGELAPVEQALWGVLGWSAENWSGSAPEPASEEKYWAELSDAERFAAEKLGYDQVIWDSN